MITTEIDFELFQKLERALQLCTDDVGRYSAVSMNMVLKPCPVHNCACIEVVSYEDEVIHLKCFEVICPNRRHTTIIPTVSTASSEEIEC
jgi:hypothetical protein